MSLHRLAPAWTLVVVLSFAPATHAFFDPPWITPANPVAGETVSVNIHGGTCDAFSSEDGYPQVTRNGNAVRILLYGSHYEPGDELCIFPTWTAVREIGSFAAGNYTLTVDMLYSHPVFGPTILNIGVVSFAVAAPAEPVSVPAGGPAGMALLAVLLAFAGWALRKS